MAVSPRNYIGTLGADVAGIENIIDEANGRLANWLAANQATGAGATALGGNCPATTATAVNTWVKITLADGSLGYIPVWK